MASKIEHVFVYGTLLPGDVRFPMMRPFVVDDGWADTVRGRLFDTGLDYPALVLDDTDTDIGGETLGAAGSSGVATPQTATAPLVIGRTFTLLAATIDEALDVLDEVEGVVGGRYRRVAVTTATGVAAWAYEYGGDLELTWIESGDWLRHRPPDRARPLAPPAAEPADERSTR
ncbi:MAG: gamma-glutamylcyclotransferase [Actinomycetota bacterium]